MAATKVPLSPRQQACIDYYLQGSPDDGRGWNGARAARQAGYSPHSAAAAASRLLGRADVKEMIAARLAALRMQADEVLRRLTEMGRADMSDFATLEICRNEDGFAIMDPVLNDDTGEPVRGLPTADEPDGAIMRRPRRRIAIDFERAQAAGKTHLIHKLGFNRYGHPEIELEDRKGAIELMGRHERLFVDRREVSGPNGGPIPISPVDLTKLSDEELDEFERWRSRLDGTAADAGGGAG